MNKRLVGATPAAHMRVFFKNLLGIVSLTMITYKAEWADHG